MTRKKKYFCMTLAAVQALIFTACMDEFESPPEKKIIREEATVTVNEAKACFEDQMMWMEGVVDGKELKGWATNFTPQWDNAVISKSESKGMAAVDVPIIADFSFRAVIYDPTNPKKKIFNEKMVQKLVVAKDLKTGRLCSYVASIIPDKDYALSKNRKLSAMDFANYSDYGNFSGWIIFSFPLSSDPLLVDFYQNGRLMDTANFINDWENPAVVTKMEELLNGFCLVRFSRIRLRGDWEVELPNVEINGKKPDDGNAGTGYGYGGGGSDGGSTGNAGGGNDTPIPGGGGNNNGATGGGGTSGTGGGTTGSPSAQAKAIIKQFNLDASGIAELNAQLAALLEVCGYEYVYKCLKATNSSFSNVKYDPNRQGSYNSTTKELTFRNKDAIKGALPEEYIHFYQDVYYPGGISQYANTANIEFEAKLITDIMCTVDPVNGGCMFFGSTQSNAVEYEAWINKITNKGNKIPNSSDLTARYPTCGNKNYWDFMNDLKNDPNRPEYNRPVIPNLQPNALLNLLNSDCYKNN